MAKAKPRVIQYNPDDESDPTGANPVGGSGANANGPSEGQRMFGQLLEQGSGIGEHAIRRQLIDRDRPKFAKGGMVKSGSPTSHQSLYKCGAKCG